VTPLRGNGVRYRVQIHAQMGAPIYGTELQNSPRTFLSKYFNFKSENHTRNISLRVIVGSSANPIPTSSGKLHARVLSGRGWRVSALRHQSDTEKPT